MHVRVHSCVCVCMSALVCVCIRAFMCGCLLQERKQKQPSQSLWKICVFKQNAGLVVLSL